ncbi:hypothetical protein HIM_02707 [Hirsutella minnesotensis 3608]|nr:hypothetical protein HIM_02707 [Hirsutella minnesotensis 3608]
MKDRNSTPAEGSASWLSSFTSSKLPFAARLSKDRRSIFHGNRPSPMIQPDAYPPTPLMMPDREPQAPSRADGEAKEVRRLRRLTFSARKRQTSDAASRRPLISAPTDFRHVASGLQQPVVRQPTLRQHARQPSLHQDISPVPPPPQITHRLGNEHPVKSRHRSPASLARFASDDTVNSSHAHSSSQSSNNEKNRPLHQGNQSFASFHIPRRQPVEAPPPTITTPSPPIPTIPTIDAEEPPPSIPPKAETRARPRTAPALDALKERVAEAMIEAEMLQRRIDEIAERQSLYCNSRPSTSHSMARTLPDSPFYGLEPMPSIPALPPMAPSFADRLKFESQRPREVVIRSLSPGASEPVSPDDACGISPSPGRLPQDGLRMAPPLPFTSRPPLRKKKSFTQASRRDFSICDGSNGRNGTKDATYASEPGHTGGWVPERTAGMVARKQPSYDSFDSVSVSTWSDGEERFADDVSAVTPEQFSPMERSATFGKHEMQRCGPSVGLAV